MHDPENVHNSAPTLHFMRIRTNWILFAYPITSLLYTVILCSAEL